MPNSSISGQATGERADFFRFSAKKDQRILIDCWAVDRILDTDFFNGLTWDGKWLPGRGLRPRRAARAARRVSTR